MSEMTSRERVLTALRHEEPDRVPVDFGGMRSTGIALQAYVRLKEFLGYKKSRPRLYDLMQWLAEPEEPMLQRLGGDVVQLHRYQPTFGIAIDEWRQWKTPDGIPCLVPAEFRPARNKQGEWEVRENGRVIAKMPADGHWFDQVYFPLAEANTFSDIDRFEIPKVTDAEVNYLRREAKRLHDETNFAILGAFGANLLEGGHFDWGYQKFMTVLSENCALAEYYLDRLTESHIECLRRYLPAVKNYIQVIQVGDDLGMQTGPQISPQMYREIFKPRHSRIYHFIKQNSDLFVFLHTCGSVYALIPDLIEAGVDIFNPVQIGAAGMEPARLKREFGRHLVFWGGGCDTQTTLLRGSVADVQQEVKKLIGIFAPGGGFVFTQVHNILREIPPEKIIVMYDAARQYGRYPIM